MLKKIKQMPVPLAIVVMVGCMLAGIALGNNNALNRAAIDADTVFAEVAELSAQRAQKAANLLVLCNRNIAGAAETEALSNAVDAVGDAARPGQVADANSRLSSAIEAVKPLLSDAASEQDQKLMTGVLDDMGSIEKLLARSVSAYNALLAEVEEVYNALPMRFLIGGKPEVYR